MKVITGRGNDRRVFEFPTGAIAERAEPKEFQAVKDYICELLGIR